MSDTSTSGDTGQAREPVMTETTRKLARRVSQYRRESLGWLKQAIRADGEAGEANNALIRERQIAALTTGDGHVDCAIEPAAGTVQAPAAEPPGAWVIGRFTDATAQHGDRTFEMWDDDVHRTSAAALHHHVMHVEDPDPWSWHIYALARIAYPKPAAGTVQAPEVAAVLDRLNVAELASDEEQEFNDGQRWMLQKIRRALLGTTREGKR